MGGLLVLESSRDWWYGRNRRSRLLVEATTWNTCCLWLQESRASVAGLLRLLVACRLGLHSLARKAHHLRH